MNSQQEYTSKLCAQPKKPFGIVQSGDTVSIPVYSNPTLIAGALANRLNELSGVTIRIGAPASDLAWYHPEAAEAFQIEPWYTSPVFTQADSANGHGQTQRPPRLSVCVTFQNIG